MSDLTSEGQKILVDKPWKMVYNILYIRYEAVVDERFRSRAEFEKLSQ